MSKSEIIGERIKAVRKSHKLTQKQLAARAGTTSCSISCWEEGKRYMSIYYLMHICDALGVSADYILFGEENEK